MPEKKLEDYYILKDGKKLKYGYTTGSCAAGAAAAAVRMLFEHREIKEISLMTPMGILLDLTIEHIERDENKVRCSVKKDAGDDPDVTDGIDVYAIVSRSEAPGINIDGGVGVGRVTQKGLEQPIGAAAINRVPRQMIENEISEVCDAYDYDGGISVVIEIPSGVELAAKTFNPNLGIKGGISVLGTKGIVVPMSEDALIKSIEVELKMRLEQGNGYLLVSPGNYGETFIKEMLQMDISHNIKCSNYVGETIDMAVNHGAKGILFVAHIGKFIKVAAGIMNTHSRNADGRAEIMAANAIRAGAELETAAEILTTLTTDAALDILEKNDLKEKTMQLVLEKIQYHLQRRCKGMLQTGVVLFSNEHGYLGEQNAKELLKKINEEIAQDKGER